MKGFWTHWTVLTHALIAAAEASDIETFAAIVETREGLLATMPPEAAGSEASAQALIAEARLREVADEAQRALGNELARLGGPRRASGAYRQN